MCLHADSLILSLLSASQPTQRSGHLLTTPMLRILLIKFTRKESRVAHLCVGCDHRGVSYDPRMLDLLKGVLGLVDPEQAAKQSSELQRATRLIAKGRWNGLVQNDLQNVVLRGAW